jgi:hypothetical protein
MKWGCSLERRLSLCLVTLLILPVRGFASTSENGTPQAPAAAQQDGQNAAPSAGNAAPVGQAQGSSTATAPAPQTATPQATDQNGTPAGTAAAPDTRPSGIAASTPSGAAIAPAKQRRVSKFSVRTALIVGAVVAVGIVAGLSLASPSRP